MIRVQLCRRFRIEPFRIAHHPLVARAGQDQHLVLGIIADILPDAGPGVVGGVGMSVGTVVGVHAKLDDAVLAPHPEKALIALRVVVERCRCGITRPFRARIPGHEHCLRERAVKTAIEMRARTWAGSEARQPLAHDVRLSFVIKLALVSTPPQVAEAAREQQWNARIAWTLRAAPRMPFVLKAALSPWCRRSRFRYWHARHVFRRFALPGSIQGLPRGCSGPRGRKARTPGPADLPGCPALRRSR